MESFDKSPGKFEPLFLTTDCW